MSWKIITSDAEQKIRCFFIYRKEKRKVKRNAARIQFPEAMNREAKGENIERNDSLKFRFKNHNELSVIQRKVSVVRTLKQNYRSNNLESSH